jgi:PPOX class probable F420-dependent enzyme
MTAPGNLKFDRVVQRRLKREYFVWFTTVGADLSPQPRPVWFIWKDESFLIFSQPNTHKVHHVKAHPNVTLHFNTLDEKGEKEVVVFVGTATIDTDTPPAHKIAAYLRKYKKGILDLGSTPEEFAREYSVAIRVKVKEVRGWP